MRHSTRFSVFFSVLVGLFVGPTSALGQNKPAYARVYTISIAPNPTAILADLEKLARKNGSIEILTFPANGTPSEPTRRDLVRMGTPPFGYPGFSVRARTEITRLAAKNGRAAGQAEHLLEDKIELLSEAIRVKWTLPQAVDKPVVGTWTVKGEEIIRVVIHPANAGRQVELAPSSPQRQQVAIG